MDRRDPPGPAGATFTVVPDVRLIAGAVGQVAVAVRAQAGVRDVVDGVGPRRVGLCLECLHRPRGGHLPDPEQVVLQAEARDQPFDAPVGVAARGQVELDRPPVVREARSPDRVGLRDEHAGPGGDVGHHEVLRAAAPSVTSDESAGGVADPVVLRAGVHRPRRALRDRADRHARRARADPQPDRTRLRGQVDPGPVGREADPDGLRQRRDRPHDGALIEVREDLSVRPAHLGHAVGAPLRHAEPVSVAGAVEREGRRGLRRRPGRGQQQGRGHERGRERERDTSKHRQPDPSPRQVPVRSSIDARPDLVESVARGIEGAGASRELTRERLQRRHRPSSR